MKSFILRTLMFLCMLTGIAVGQARYVSTTTYSLADNNVACRTTNCFLQTSKLSTGGDVTLVQISTGYDYSVYGLDASGNIYNLPFGNNPKWTKITAMGTATNLAVRTATEIYGIRPGNSCANQLAVWNGSSWTQRPVCLDQISITADGVLLWIVNSTTRLVYSLSPLSGPLNAVIIGTGWNYVEGQNVTQAYGRRGTTLYSVNLPAKTYTAVTGVPVSVVSSFAVTLNGQIFMTSSQSGANGNMYAIDYTEQTPTWRNIPGGGDGVFGSSTVAMFVIKDTLIPYHYLGLAVSGGVNIQGHYDCTNYLNGQCPAGSYHHATAHAMFPHGLIPGGSVQTVGGLPSDQLSAAAMDWSETCDPIFGDSSSSECVLQNSDSNVTCDEMGPIDDAPGGGGYTIERETAYTKFANLGTLKTGQVCVTVAGGEVCSWNVTPICSNTSNPDYKYVGGPPPLMWIRDYDWVAWRSAGECMRVVFNGNHTPWLCMPIWPANVETSDATPGVCSYNP